LHWISPRQTGSVGEPADEARAEIGATRHRRQADVILHAFIDVVEALRCERRSGRKHGAKRRQSNPSFGTSAIFFCASMYFADVPKCVIRSASQLPQDLAPVQKR
jgi:predicted metal-binding protein